MNPRRPSDVPPAPKALLKVGYACNNRCLFCHSHRERDTAPASTAALAERIGEARRRGLRMIVYSGGEPTIRPDIAQLIELPRALGLDLGFVSNGRRFSQRPFVDACHRRGLRYAYVSLHGACAETHNTLVGAAAYDQVLAGIAHVAALGNVALTVNTVVCRENLGQLEAIVRLLAGIGNLRIKFSVLEGKGAAMDAFRTLSVPLGVVAQRIYEALAFGEQLVAGRSDVQFGHDGLPPCLAAAHSRYHDDLRANGILFMSEAFEDRLYPVDERNKAQGIACATCALCETCAGIFAAYVRLGLDDALEPLPVAVGNSFNYEAIERWPDFELDACPVQRDPAVLDAALHASGGTAEERVGPERALLVLPDAGRPGATLCVTRANNFDDATVAYVRDALGQVYVRRDATQPTVADFRCDLALLERQAACAACPVRGRCPGAFARAAAADPFGAAEEAVCAAIAAARGRVLELGCGSIRHGEALSRAVAAGLIEYVGVEPDPRAVAEARQRFPLLDTRIGRAESPPLDGRTYDAILLLRSYNHLVSPERALERLVGALAPGGILVIAENVAFGLLVDAAAGPQPRPVWDDQRFEHFRNSASHEVLGLLAPHGLAVRQHVPVMPGRANQWLIVAARAGDECDSDRGVATAGQE